ncbi:aldo/keto reductase [uncultured Tolumonas sp.]|uniref:aldo/keto reductase n=1 Tax=uncultured Tolumonas sp. TaxID=263765 RepID=UPI002A0A386A|nr:aldo/keto reductase [uncultured Tolumonas sp.]
MKLALGTAQFGLDYGISNTVGKVSDHELQQILRLADEAGIRLLDTAQAYGDAESRLGQFISNNFQVISKLAPGTTAATARTAVLHSLNQLKQPSLYGLMLHRTQDYSAELWQELQRMQSAGLIGKLGISVYTPEELDEWYAHNPLPSLVQLPANLLDQRFLRSGWLDRLKDAQCEIHVRSVFLQGLLLMPPAQRPPRFSRFNANFGAFDTLAQQYGRLTLALAIQYAMPQIDRLVIGCCSAAELSDIVRAYQQAPILNTSELASLISDDIQLLNPALWGQL